MGTILYFKFGITFLEFFATLVGFITWQKLQKSYWRFFPVYLLIIAILEVLCYWLALVLKLPYLLSQNIYPYIIIPAEFLFFFWLFYSYGSPKRMILVGVGLYILCFFIEIWLNQQGKKFYFLSFSYSIGNIIMLIFIFQYFIKLSNSERILNFYHERMFWVSLGLLVFWLGTFPYYGLFNFLMKKHFDLFMDYSWVMIFLDYAMYLLFAASFIWGKDK